MPGLRLRFGADVPPQDAERWRERATTEWGSWTLRFGAAAGPPFLVESADPATMLGLAGHQEGATIRLSRLLPRVDAETVLLHELAHAYLASRCPDLARAAPVVGEAFALHASGDAARRALADERFPFAASARDSLVAHEGTARGDEADTQAALSRILSQPGAGPAWERWFRATLAACASPSFSPARAHAELFERVRTTGRPEVPVRFDFLLVEGTSQRSLAQEGRVDEAFPTGSILKPSLVAAVPALLAPRAARDSPEWHCPGPPVPGEPWTWPRALALSCNGFFLDLPVTESAEAFGEWRREMALLGMRNVPAAMPAAVGLAPGARLSPAAVVRLYAWLAAKAPWVVDALRETPRDGTVSASADAGWFLERRIALKTGTVRDAGNTPHDAWIAAVGPRLPSGEPAFIAALHASGLPSFVLLPRLRERLERALPAENAAARVQVLGLAPAASISLGCDPGVPLAVRDAAGAWSLRPPGEVIAAASLEAGTRVGCLAAPLAVPFTSSRGDRSRRRCAGWLDVDPPPASTVESQLPIRERSARARLGSRFVLATSEREYVESTLLSEHAGGRPEVLKALALVTRHDLHVDRHGGRPPCDTTHCHLFGLESDRSDRTGVRAAVAATAGLRLETDDGGPAWLSFYAGGEERWSRRVTASEVRARLALTHAPRELRFPGHGTVEVDSVILPCELLRNQLRLPSCPDQASAGGDGFVLSGRGEGHGEGMDLAAAERAAAGGASFRDILSRSYPGIRVVER